MNIFRLLFARLSSRQRPAAASSPVAAVAPATAADAGAAPHWQAPLDIDARYFHWLAGGDARHGISAATEKTILTALSRLAQSELAGAQLIPRVPSVLPQLLKSLRDENVSGQELARQIARDVVLVGELISEVNSSYYSPPSRILSLDNAVRLLGLNGLRMLVARVAFRPLIQMQSGRLTKAVAPRLWEQAEKCALACRLLAQQRQLDAFHGFLAGLSQNVGLMVAFRVADQVGDTDNLACSDAFRQAFLAEAAELSCRIAAHWEFPPAVLQALAQQKLARQSGLGLVLRQAGQLSKLRLLLDQQQLQEAELQLEQAPQLQACLRQLNQPQG